MKESGRGWLVTFSGIGINLALGILYAWSVIKGAIPDSWGWSNADKALPYSIACIIFSLTMIPAGRLQDKIGPRWVATIGGILTGAGAVVSGLAGSSLAGFVAGFGILSGAGIGFGYASATPAAVKWFPSHKTGLIAGLVVAGFGLASVYIAPLGTYLLGRFGISVTMIIFGTSFLVIVTVLAQFLKNPPAGYVPAGSVVKKVSPNAPLKDKNWRDMMKNPQFYILWFMYFAGAAAGLTFIGFAQQLGKKSLGDLAFAAVAVLAVGNAGGRIVAGLMSDRIGRQWTLFTFMSLQALVVFILYTVKSGAGWLPILTIIFLIGANYGSNLALFPSASKDYFGIKNFGVNYGILFTAWGAAGLIMPWFDGIIKDISGGSNDWTYYLIIGMLIAAAYLTFVSTMLADKEKEKLNDAVK